MNRAFLCCLPLLAVAAPANAGELLGGIYKHDVRLPTDLSGIESGVDFQVGYRGGRIGGTPLQPYILGAVNSAGDTNYAAVGLSAKFGHSIYIRPGLGLAVSPDQVPDPAADIPSAIASATRMSVSLV